MDQTQTINQKIEKLKVFLEKSPIEDINNLYIQILDDIFSPDLTNGSWALLSRRRCDSPYTYDSIMELLDPCGLFINQIKQLCVHEANFRYSFPLRDLSRKTQHDLQTNQKSFWGRKLPHLSSGPHMHYSLQLNALEYYFMKFASLLPKCREVQLEERIVDCAYTSLFLRYVKYFFFLEPRSLELWKYAYTVSSARRSAYSSYSYSPWLYRLQVNDQSSYAGNYASAYLDDRMMSSSFAMPSSSSSAVSPSGVGKTVGGGGGGYLLPGSDLFWMTETFLQSIYEFWLRSCVLPSYIFKSRSNHRSSPSALEAHLQNDLLPTEHMVSLIRVFIKFLFHFLFTSQSNLSPSSSDEQECLNALFDWKCSSLQTESYQIIYEFFFVCLQHWPHDFSFSTIMETWLTAIQPWRYCRELTTTNCFQDNNLHLTPSLELDQLSSAGDQTLTTNSSIPLIEQWKKLIRENSINFLSSLLIIFHRIESVDMQSSRNARLIYRLGKVLHEPLLKDYIHSLLTGHGSKSHVFFTASSSSSYRQSSTGLIDINYPQEVKKLFWHCYEEAKLSLQTLLRVYIKLLHSHGNLLSRSPSDFASSQISSVDDTMAFLNKLSLWIRSFFSSGNHSLLDLARTSNNWRHSGNNSISYASDESADSLDKYHATYLAYAIHYLMEIFNFEEYQDLLPRLQAKTVPWQELVDRGLAELNLFLKYPVNSSNSLEESYSGDDVNSVLPSFKTPISQRCARIIQSPNDVELTPLGRYQMLNGIRKWPAQAWKPSNDPFNGPRQPWESQFLLSTSLSLTNFINTKYSTQLKQLCNRPDFCGKLSRYLLLPSSPKPNEDHNNALVPRVNLRLFANKRFYLGLFLLYFVNCLFFGYNSFTLLFFLILFWFIKVSFQCAWNDYFPCTPPAASSSSVQPNNAL